MPEPCPECQQGKHIPNCDGTTWNDQTDAPDVCPCYMAGHGEETHEHVVRTVLREVAPHRRVGYRLYAKTGRAAS